MKGHGQKKKLEREREKKGEDWDKKEIGRRVLSRDSKEMRVHCKKGLAVFLSPAGMSLIKLFLGGNNLVFPAQREFDQ